MTTSMYCLYVGVDYTYIDVNALAQEIKSFLVSSRYMYVCMYVLMYVCMYVCMYVWMHACSGMSIKKYIVFVRK